MKNRSSIRDRIRKSPYVRLALGLVVVLAAVIVVQVIVTSLPLSRLPSRSLLTVVTVAAAVGAYVWFFRWAEARRIAELDRDTLVRETLVGMLVGALMFAICVAVLAGVGAFRVDGTNPWNVLLIPLIINIGSAVFEEILFRGVLFRLLEEGVGTWLALLASALLFGGLHLINENATLMGAVGVALEAGFTLAAAYMLTRRLWIPIGLHFAWNFVQSGIFGIAVSGTTPLPGLLQSVLTGPTWLTGGEFGVEASVVAMVLGLAVGGVFLAMAIRRNQLISPGWTRLPK